MTEEEAEVGLAAAGTVEAAIAVAEALPAAADMIKNRAAPKSLMEGAYLAAWTAEEQEGKAQTATRPHPQEVMGVQAGGVVTCAVTAEEASVIGVEGLPEEVVSLQGGVAEIGAEDHPGAAGTRLPDSVLS